MAFRKSGKCRVNFQFDLTLHELVVPDNIRSKIPSNSAFYVVWKRGHDEPIESKHAVLMKDYSNNKKTSNNIIGWRETEVLSMKCVLIKYKQSEEYMSKQCRVLLKQMHGDKQTHSTIGAAKLDLKDYASYKQPTAIDIHFTKCNIANIYLKATVNVITMEDESDEDDNLSVASARTIEVEGMGLDWDESNTPPDLPPEEHQTPLDDILHAQGQDGAALSPQEVASLHVNLDSREGRLPNRNVGGYHTGNTATYVPLADEDVHTRVSPNITIRRTSNIGQAQIAELFRQCAQLETRVKLQQDDNEELKTELQEMSDKYDELFSRHKELERQRRAQDASFEKERTSFETQLTDAQEKLANALTELKTAKAENAQMEEQIARHVKKYNELVGILSASKNQLQQKIAELSHQNDDLESTLVMVRNSWNQTGNVMENQVNLCNNKIERLTKELNDLRSKYESMQPEFQMQEQIIENLQQQRLQTETDMTNLELKCASQSVEVTRMKTQLSEAQARVDKMRAWILDLLQQGVLEINEENENPSTDIVNDILQNGSLENLMVKLNGINGKNQMSLPLLNVGVGSRDEENKDHRRYEDNNHTGKFDQNQYMQMDDTIMERAAMIYTAGHKSRESMQDVLVEKSVEDVVRHVSGLNTPVSDANDFENDKENAYNYQTCPNDNENEIMSSERPMELVD